MLILSIRELIIKWYIFNENLIANALEKTDYCPTVLIKMPTMTTSGHSTPNVAGLSAICLKLIPAEEPSPLFSPCFHCVICRKGSKRKNGGEPLWHVLQYGGGHLTTRNNTGQHAHSKQDSTTKFQVVIMV